MGALEAEREHTWKVQVGLFQQHLAAGHVDRVGAADALVRFHTVVARVIAGVVQQIRFLAVLAAVLADAGQTGAVRLVLGECFELVGEVALVAAVVT